MTTDAASFNNKMTAWKENQAAPWNRLRYQLAFENLERHLPENSLQILDIGGGDGRETLPLAQRGHAVTLLDFSSEMLDEATRTAEQAGVSANIKTILADLSEIPRYFPQPSFDLVLCHNVLQYAQDAASVLHTIGTALHQGGRLSLITPNPASEAYRQALRELDLKAALDSLDQTTVKTVLFGLEMRLFTLDQLTKMLTSTGFHLIADYGIRCVNDYIQNNDLKFQAEFYEQLVSLERAMGTRAPYKHLARFYHIIAQKEIQL